MKNSNKTVLLIVLILIAAGLIGYRLQKDKNDFAQNVNSNQAKNSESMQGSAEVSGDQSDLDVDELDKIEEDFENACQNGQWKKITDVSGEMVTLSGKLRKVYSEDDIPQDLKNFSYYIENQTNAALSGSNLANLDFFEDRAVEVQGVKSQDGKSVTVVQVRCGGTEADKTAIDGRTKMMNWLAENINVVAPQKALFRKWTIDTVDFVDEGNVYVEYYDVAEDDENADISVDTSRKILLEMSDKGDGGYVAKALAYWEMGDEDYTLKTGSDKFEDVSDTMTYQYDSEEKSWTRI